MSNVKHTITRALMGAVAVAALSLAASAGTAPVAHADPYGGLYPPNVYGPGSSCTYCFTLTGGPWYDSGGVGLQGQAVYTYSNGPDSASTGPDGATTVATWRASGLDPYATYDVCAYIPSDNADATAWYDLADYFGAYHFAGFVEQARFSNQWALVQRTASRSDGSIVAYLTDQSPDPYGSTVIGADAMMFIPASQDALVPIDNQPNAPIQCIPTTSV
jgi:hypothetical protein